MCRPVACKSCGKITWSGCGLHVDQIRSRVPASEWCDGHRGGAHREGSGLFRRLLGRGSDSAEGER